MQLLKIKVPLLSNIQLGTSNSYQDTTHGGFLLHKDQQFSRLAGGKDQQYFEAETAVQSQWRTLKVATTV